MTVELDYLPMQCIRHTVKIPWFLPGLGGLGGTVVRGHRYFHH
ncbi:predicted protein [Plenodomus lingam JN3]|uniref:Predicted protein n=1 Tax=Leptosphaeria maculans (strain JN3 / isolate v23.1.3 / race Av1-4-5-6-7-8) TaxID=985895 RepID=E4ZPR9_LEPMJ|nr:predicted protein [Plenodomus lingam JN3]CBX93454.1 predicted protein [Plenodomus lingam JN3]